MALLCGIPVQLNGRLGNKPRIFSSFLLMSQPATRARHTAGRLFKSAASSAFALSAVAGGVMVSGGEAQAAPTLCVTFSPPVYNNEPCVNTGPSVSWTVADQVLSAPVDSGIVDLTDNNPPGPLESASVDVDFDPTSQVSGATSGSYQYSITSTSPYGINQAGLTSSIGQIGADYAVKKEIYSDSARTILVATLNVDEITQSAFTLPFQPATKLWITDTWTTTTVGMDNFLNIYQTPGPLPLLGAGAAFGFSRKLRGRIKASSAA